MAKGDKQKQQNQLDFQTKTSQNQTNNLVNDAIVPQTQTLMNNYDSALGGAKDDYASIMGQYKNFQPSPFVPINFNPVKADLVNYERTPEFNEGMGYYRDFANTGGFKDTDLSNIRARSVSPIRAIYANAQNNLERNKNLQGGYAPNLGAVTSKMARESSGLLADKMAEVEGDIARMVQQGKMFGTQGFGNMADKDLSLGTQVKLANQAANNNVNMFNADGTLRTGMFNADSRLKDDASRLAAINGQANLYSATPGMASMLGNQMLSSTGNWLQGQNMLNNIGQNAIQQQTVNASIPSNFQQGLGNLGSIFNTIGQIGGAISPFFGAPNFSKVLPSTRATGASPYYVGPQLSR